MKTKLLILAICVALASCTPEGNKYEGPKANSPILIPGKDYSTEAYDTTAKAAPATAAATPIEKGAQASPASVANGKSLISKSDCLGCHKLDAKLVGPSYQDVAKKYSQADAAILEGKIIKGGSGNWGEIPMSAHQTISMADAKDMVNYILSLK